MTVENEKFVADMLRGIQSSIVDLGQRISGVEQRMGNLERRQTASTHFEQSVLAHLASIHESVDGLRADLLGIDRRVRAVEGR